MPIRDALRPPASRSYAARTRRFRRRLGDRTVTDVARAARAKPDLARADAACSGRRSRTGRSPAARPRRPPFSVFEKTRRRTPGRDDARRVTSEDIMREYLARLRAVRSQRPDVSRDARAQPARHRRRARARRRAGGRAGAQSVPRRPGGRSRTTSTCSELPTTGGSLALVDHRPRLDSRVAAGMQQGGAVVLGKANLDEFPFGDFGISTVGGTIGNAYDPSLSTAGSSGGSATAVATSLAALGFGTDTCNSLSNPAAFASLATIRDDARADQPRRRDAAQSLQRCGRTDGEVRARRRPGARPGDRARSPKIR